MKNKCFNELKLEFIQSLMQRLELCKNTVQQYNVVTVSIDDFQKKLIQNKLMEDC